MNNIKVREDFRRDGLAANFLVGGEQIKYLAKALPGSIINIGYPGICSEEYKSCEEILNLANGNGAELSVVGHMTKAHVDLLLNITKSHFGVSANTWLPISDYFIKKTFNEHPETILNKAEQLIRYWKNNTNAPIDVALTDVTAQEKGLDLRTANWAEKLIRAGARNIILCDTRGIGVPENLDLLFSQTKLNSETTEFHPHNDNGLALQNVNVAIKHGINVIGSSIYGAGERRTMLDTISLESLGLNVDKSSYALFEESYKSIIVDPIKNIEQVLGKGVVATGTQYRLRGRDKSLKKIFGVTSDRYILGELLNIPREELSEKYLEILKNNLLYKLRNIYFEGADLKNKIGEYKCKNL